MQSLTKAVFIVSLFFLLAGCGQKVRRDGSMSRPGTARNIPDSIIGERVRGRVEVRSEPGGKVLFVLRDSTLVSCAKPQGGWYAVGLYMELPAGEYGGDTLHRGKKIVVKGKAVGEVLSDMPVTTSSSGKESWAELTGFVPAERIYPFSVIEQALAGYMDTVKARTVESLQPFIHSFALEREEALKPFITWFSYESWIDDPSPLPRVQLVFWEHKLVGVVHSRPLRLPHTADHPLERGFRVLFYNDTPKDIKESFVKQFNSLITSVD